MNPLLCIFSTPMIITASAVSLACLVCLLVLCAPRVRVRVETKVEVEVK